LEEFLARALLATDQNSTRQTITSERAESDQRADEVILKVAAVLQPGRYLRPDCD
jgi:hypothetical protein